MNQKEQCNKASCKTMQGQFVRAFWELERHILTSVKKDELNLYIHERPQRRMYHKAFGLCILLGATDLYDIGCGHDLQAGLIADLEGISYTGIDRCNERMAYITEQKDDGTSEPKIVAECTLYRTMRENPCLPLERYEDYFASFNDRIRFMHAVYPFPIHARENNIALVLNWLDACTDAERHFISEALNRDFKRVLLTVDAENAVLWRDSLSAFSFRELDRARYYDEMSGTEKDGLTFLFGTKNAEELSYLKEIGYNIHDDRFFVDSVRRDRYLNSIHQKENG